MNLINGDIFESKTRFTMAVATNMRQNQNGISGTAIGTSGTESRENGNGRSGTLGTIGRDIGNAM